jgi:hypothetical protein
MTYFSNFGRVWHTLPNGTQIIINDTTRFVSFAEKYRKNPRLNLKYTIADGDRPDLISYRLYGSVDYWWTILLLNSIQTSEDWPKTSDELDRYISIKYPFQDTNDPHHYEDVYGLVADPRAIRIKRNLASDQDAIVAANLTPISILDYETQENDKKRNILLIDPGQILRVDEEMKELFNE